MQGWFLTISISKAEAYIVEGYNSLFRHFLPKMRRKTKWYSKSLKMLEYSILLLMLKRNKQLDLIIINLVTNAKYFY